MVTARWIAAAVAAVAFVSLAVAQTAEEPAGVEARRCSRHEYGGDHFCG
jgi:hypothetical protein